MKRVLFYIYYRLAKTYKNIFGIDDAPGYMLIQSCYSWGLLILVTAMFFYSLTIEDIILWHFSMKLDEWLIIITALPFAIFYIFAEHYIGDLKQRYKTLEKTYHNEKVPWLKGFFTFLFVILSIISLCTALHYCK